MRDTANLIEIFSSIQGEGLYIGKRQLFIRFASCNLDCGYCDTPVEESHAKTCLVEWISGSGDFEEIVNPVTESVLLGIAEKFLGEKFFHHSLSLTGGEPLLYTPFLNNFLSHLKERIPVYLETNGTLYDELESIINYIDIVAMDIKLPETSGIAPQWENHSRFLEIANEKETFVKVVVSDCTMDDEFARAVELVANMNDNIPFVIQPMTNDSMEEKEKSSMHLFGYYEFASSCLKDVRIIPQSHKMMGIL